MSDEKRDGFVIERDGVWLSGVMPSGTLSWSDQPGSCLVVGEEFAANAMRYLVIAYVGRDDVRVELLSVALAKQPKSLGQVASESAPGTSWEMLSETSRVDWERVAQAVVEEHERRKR